MERLTSSGGIARPDTRNPTSEMITFLPRKSSPKAIEVDVHLANCTAFGFPMTCYLAYPSTRGVRDLLGLKLRTCPAMATILAEAGGHPANRLKTKCSVQSMELE